MEIQKLIEDWANASKLERVRSSKVNFIDGVPFNSKTSKEVKRESFTEYCEKNGVSLGMKEYAKALKLAESYDLDRVFLSRKGKEKENNQLDKEEKALKIQEETERFLSLIRENIITVGSGSNCLQFFYKNVGKTYSQLKKEPALRISGREGCYTFSSPDLRKEWLRIAKETTRGMAIEIRNEIEKELIISSDVSTSNIGLDGKEIKVPPIDRILTPFSYYGSNKYISSEELLAYVTNDRVAVYAINLAEVALGSISKWLEIVSRVHRPFQFCLAIADFVNPSLPSRRAMFMKGSGHDGKSVLSKALIKFMGDKSVSIAGDESLSEHVKAQIPESSVVEFQELKKADLVDNPIFKTITGNDVSTMNKKYEEPVSAQFLSKVLAHTNDIIYCDFYKEAAISRYDAFHFSPRKKMGGDSEFEKKLHEQTGSFVLFCLCLKKKYMREVGEEKGILGDCSTIEDYKLGQFSGVGFCGSKESHREFWKELSNRFVVVKMDVETQRTYGLSVNQYDFCKDFIERFYSDRTGKAVTTEGRGKSVDNDIAATDTKILLDQCQGFVEMVQSRIGKYDETLSHHMPIVPKEFSGHFEVDNYHTRMVEELGHPRRRYDRELKKLNEYLEDILLEDGIEPNVEDLGSGDRGYLNYPHDLLVKLENLSSEETEENEENDNSFDW